MRLVLRFSALWGFSCFQVFMTFLLQTFPFSGPSRFQVFLFSGVLLFPGPFSICLACVFLFGLRLSVWPVCFLGLRVFALRFCRKRPSFSGRPPLPGWSADHQPWKQGRSRERSGRKKRCLGTKPNLQNNPNAGKQHALGRCLRTLGKVLRTTGFWERHGFRNDTVSGTTRFQEQPGAEDTKLPGHTLLEITRCWR